MTEYGISENFNLPVTEDFSRFVLPAKERILRKLDEVKNLGMAEAMRCCAELSSTEKAIMVHMLSLRKGATQALGRQGTSRIYLNTLLGFFAASLTPVEAVKPWHVEDWQSGQIARNLKPATVSTRLAVLKSFFGYLWKLGIIPLNPAAAIKASGRVRSYHAERVLLREECLALIRHMEKHAPLREALLCKTLFFTGVRAAEAVGMTWGDFHKDVKGRWNTTIRGKGDKIRTVYIPEMLMGEFRLWSQALHGTMEWKRGGLLATLPVFPSPRNLCRPLTTISVWKMVNRWGEKVLGKKISPHWFRHSFATHARLAGAGMEQIKAQLGHESIQTTARYEHSAQLSEAAGEHLEWSFTEKA